MLGDMSTRCVWQQTFHWSNLVRVDIEVKYNLSREIRRIVSIVPVRSHSLILVFRSKDWVLRNLEFTGKPVPKTFAVCTIRSTPSTAHHCIAWSKSYLFPYVHLSSLSRCVSIYKLTMVFNITPFLSLLSLHHTLSTVNFSVRMMKVINKN